jgi:sigma-B regulation protein RsbU (phosphoserine phosphatase)
MTNSVLQNVQPPTTILVVEDQPEVQQALRMLLAPYGHDVTLASTPEEALEDVARCRFDLVLLDMNYRRDTTSGTEGLQLLSLLRSRGIDAPVIAMTAWGSVEVAVQAMHGGACDFVQKPWDNHHLLRLVDQHIYEERRKRQIRNREEREWQEAAAVHRRLMPHDVPQFAGLSLAAISKPAGYIGGDYYDFFSMGEKLAICIGDVVGKGLPAALMMSNLQAAVKVTAAHWVAPSEVCHNVNELACSNGASDKFISFFYAVLDLPTRQLTYSNCGHNQPILLRADGSVERLHLGGTLIGLNCNEHFQEGVLQLNRGDRLLLFTDGLSEAEDADLQAYGEERLIETLRTARGSVKSVLDFVFADVNGHCKSRFQDDVTAVMLFAD